MEMEVVYLGIFSWIFDKVFNAILSPVFKFISGLLEPVLQWLFNNVLGPLLKDVFWPLFQMVLDLILDIFSEIFYSILAQILQIVDSLQQAFNIFSGIQSVGYRGQQYSLLELIFRLDAVQRAVLVMIAISFVLTMGFAVIATTRSMMDLDGEMNRPVSKVLSATFKAMLKMALIPIVCFFAIVLSCNILIGIHTAMGGDQTTLGRMVFVVSSLDASRTAKLNTSGKVNNSDKPVTISPDIGINDPVREPYYKGTKAYTNKDQVEKDFVFKRFDYLVGYGASLFLIIILFICLISFVTRIFEVILLFLISPLFASVQPLDDGEKFRSWQDMFVAKLFGGFGTVMAMELYMIICPAIMGGNIIFGEGSTEANYLLRIVFLLGGAWATIKMGPTVTSLLSATGGQLEADSARSTTGAVIAAGSVAVAGAGFVVSQVSGFAARRKQVEGRGSATMQKWSEKTSINPPQAPSLGSAGGALAGTISSNSNTGGSGGSTGGSLSSNAGQDVTRHRRRHSSSGSGGSGSGGSGTRRRSGSGSGTGSSGGGSGSGGSSTRRSSSGSSGGSGAGSGGSSTRHSSSGSGAGSGGSGTRHSSSGSSGGSGTRHSGSGTGSGSSTRHGSAETGSSTSRRGAETGGATGTAASTAGTGTGRGPKKAALKGQIGSSGRFTLNTSKGGHHYVGLNFGGLGTLGRDSEGNFRARFLGFGRRIDKAGNTDKVYLPVIRLKRDSDGELRLSALKFGPLKFKRAVTETKNADGSTSRDFGSMYCSDFSPIGLQRRFDSQTGNVERQSLFGTHYEKNASGNYAKAYSKRLVYKRYEQDASGKSHTVERQGLFFNKSYDLNADGTKELSSFSTKKGTSIYEKRGNDT